MDAEMKDLVVALTALMQEETAALRTPISNRRLAELARAKFRLVGQLEYETARCGGLPARAAEDEGDDELVAAISGLSAAALDNSAALARQIEITGELLDALVAEARRLSGRRASTYLSDGILAAPDPALPIAINGRF